METKEKETMLKFTYGALTGAGIVIGVILFLVKNQLANDFMIYFSLVPFFVFVVGLYGLIAHYVMMDRKLHMLFYPVLMGGLFMLLLILHILLLLPLLCPDFQARF